MGITEGCNCLGFKTASEAPVKRYNLLVPAVFPLEQPDYQKDLPNGVQKKMKKLGEYLEKYPERSEKVSRRLERRLRKELAAGSYGYVKVSAYAYVHLLKAGQSASALFAKELLGEDHDLSFIPVIRTLLKHQTPELHVWGLDILSQFTRVQVDSRYQNKLEEYVDDAVSMAHANRASSSDNSKADGKGSVKGQIRNASLAALGEFLKLNGRTQAVPEYLERLTECGLENLNFSAAQAPGGSTIVPPSLDPTMEDAPSPADNPGADAGGDKGAATPNQNPFQKNTKGIENKVRSSISKLKSAMTMDRRPKNTKDEIETDDMGAVLLREIADYSQDSTTRRRVLMCMFRYIDSQQLWSNPDRVEACLSILRSSCTEDHQYFVLFSSLIRHLSSQRLSTVDRATLIKFAAAEGELQRSAFSSPCLVFALSELPKYLPQPADSSDKVHLKNSILACIKRLAHSMTDSSSIIEAVCGLLDRLSHTTSLAMASLECMSTALVVVPSIEQQTHSKRLPMPLLQELLMVVSAWKELEARNDAHSALEALLSCSALDQPKVQLLLSAIFNQMCQTDSKPADFMMINATAMATVEGSINQATLLDMVVFTLSLQTEALQPTGGNMAHCSPARRLAALVVSDLLLEKLGQLLSCPSLETLCTRADDCKNAVEVESPFCLLVVEPNFSDSWDSAAAESLGALAVAAKPEGVLAAASALLQEAGLPSEALKSPWQRSAMPQRSTISSPSRSVADTNHARLSEGVLHELQANFASLAVTQEDVLVKGAVGVNSLVEAAKGQAMEAELKGSRMPQRRNFGEMLASVENRAFAVELAAL